MKKSIWTIITTLLLVACGSDDKPGDDTIVSKDYINVSPNLQLLGDGQETELKITANCKWTIYNPESWLTVTPMSGSNNETVKVSAGKNSTGQERTAKLTISGGDAPTRTVMVTQAKGSDESVAKTLSADKISLSFAAEGETQTFSIMGNTSWTITKPDWCSLSTSSGSGDSTIYVTASENTSDEQRYGQIVITAEGIHDDIIINVTQQAGETPVSDIPGMNDNIPPT